MNSHKVTKYEIVDYMTQRGVCDSCGLEVESTYWDEEDRLPFWSPWFNMVQGTEGYRIAKQTCLATL